MRMETHRTLLHRAFIKHGSNAYNRMIYTHVCVYECVYAPASVVPSVVFG